MTSFFRCTTSAGQDLCFNGGVCQQLGNESSIQQCSCPSGWGPDNIAFKNANCLIKLTVVAQCALPNHALLALLLLQLVTTAAILVLFYRARSRAKDRAKRILNYANLSVILFCGQVLAIYLENGWYTATSVMTTLVIPAFSMWGKEMSEIMALPIFALRPKLQANVKTFIERIFYLFIVMNTATSISLAVCAQISDGAFNIAMLIWQLFIFGSVSATSLMMAYYARELKRQYSERALENKDALDRKLSSIIAGCISFIFGQLPGLFGSIVLLVIGSAPFYWVFLFLIFSTTPLPIAKATLAIFRSSAVRDDESKASKHVSSKLDMKSLQVRASGGEITRSAASSNTGQS